MANTKKQVVPVDRRNAQDRRKGQERRKQDIPVAAERRATERRKVPRRRQIDPTTCERDYTQDEIEFMHALDAYKRANGRMFPTCSEILEVIRDLGYTKMAGQQPNEADSDTAPTMTDTVALPSIDSHNALQDTPPTIVE